MAFWSSWVQQVWFQGTYYAKSNSETFYGYGGFDTVTYANAPSAGSVGDYDVGVTVSLGSPYLNTGWAFGDTHNGVEKIVGSTHTDWLYGNAQPNVLDGGGSPDFIYGRDGNDTILGSGGFDFLYGEGGNDLLDGQWQTDTSYGGDGDDQIWGGSNFLRREYPGTNYADVLYGDSGNDQLHGDARLPGGGLRTEYLDSLDLSAGRDELHGGPGHDLLNGDGADDTLWGDSGGDVFQFDATYVVLDMEGGIYAITPGNDVVKDFNFAEGDRLDFNQGIQFADSPVGMVITLLGPDNAVQGSVLLEGVHTFDSAWIV
jgi:Ca2+-binding RTX toxin-like protein